MPNTNSEKLVALNIERIKYEPSVQCGGTAFMVRLILKRADTGFQSEHSLRSLSTNFWEW